MGKVSKAVVLFLCVAALAFPLVSAEAAPVKDIKIAYIGPLTGVNTLYGQTQRNAITMAVEKINAEGGINGAKVVVEWNDDKSDPNETVMLASKVCDDPDVLTVFGPFSTTSAMACTDIFNDAKIPVCSASVSHPDWTNMGEGRYFRGDSTQLQMMVAYCDFIVNQMGVKRVAMYYVQSDWGVSVYDSFKAEFERLGGTLVHSDMFALETKDFMASLSRFKQMENDYDLFFLAGHINEASLIVNQMRRLGITKPLITNNSLQMQAYIDIVKENAENQLMLSYFADSGNTEKFTAFSKEFEERYDTKVDLHAFTTTDLIDVMFAAMKQSGNDREKFVQAMHATKDFQGLQTKVNFEPNGDIDKPFTPVVVKNGIFVVWTKP